MPSDLQLIDSIEHLRLAFAQANPDFLAPAAPPEENHAAPEERVAAAWLQVVTGRTAHHAEARRWLRDGTRKLLAGEMPALKSHATAAAAHLQRLQRWAREFPAGLEQATRKRLWPLVEQAPARSAGEEAEAWSETLPGLGRAAAPWRLLSLLGRTVLVPEAPLRRFMWRFGLLDDDGATKRSPAAEAVALQSQFEQLQRLSSLAPGLLLVLLRWQVGLAREWLGGGFCTPRPQCPLCPVRAACTWAKFHPEDESATDVLDLEDAERLATLRELVTVGRQAELGEVELLALVLHAGAKGASALDLASELLRHFENLAGIERAFPSELMQVRGISQGRALVVKAALELGRRFASAGLRPGEPIACSSDVWRAYRARFLYLPQEHFVIILLDAKHRVITDQIVSKGTLTGSLAHPREVFAAAVRHAAAGIILLHNHPSGDPAPSHDDRSVTRRLKEAGEILGIKVLDHIILGADRFYSFSDEE